MRLSGEVAANAPLSRDVKEGEPYQIQGGNPKRGNCTRSKGGWGRTRSKEGGLYQIQGGGNRTRSKEGNQGRPYQIQGELPVLDLRRMNHIYQIQGGVNLTRSKEEDQGEPYQI